MKMQKVFICVLLALFFVPSANCQSTQNNNLKHQFARDYSTDQLFERPAIAIYFQFVGARLHPTYPIFISSIKPSQKQLGEMFKWTGYIDNIEQFIVSENDLKRMQREIRDVLPKNFKAMKKQRNSNGKYDFGFIENKKMFVRSLNVSEYFSALWTIQKVSAGKYTDLYKTISNTKMQIKYPKKESEKLTENQSCSIAFDNITDEIGDKAGGHCKMSGTLKNDGWHVDVDIIKIKINFNEAHYVIDAYSGKIKSKVIR